MRLSARSILVVYLLVIFVSLPFLPAVVTYFRDRFGQDSLGIPMHAALVICALLPALRLVRSPRPAPPWPHVSYALLLLAALVVLRTLVSSPVGRVHLAEYGILGILVLAALPRPWTVGRHLQAFAATSCIGLVDELVQHVLPTRVFDWYDVGLNSAAGLLGVLTVAWWRWTTLRKGR